jgi:hypothetical protein
MKPNLVLSTRPFDGRADDWRSALSMAADLGFTELEARIDAGAAPDADRDVASALAERRLRVRCARRPDRLPSADDWTARTPGGLAAASDAARRDALSDAVALAAAAGRVGCDLIVVSLGAIEWEGSALREIEIVRRTAERGASDAEAARSLASLRTDASARAAAAADRACRALHELLGRAPDSRVAVAGARLPLDLADPERLQWILDDFRGKPLFYWHEVRSAEAQRALGLAEPGEWLDRFSPRLAGASLHDAHGLDAPRVPGTGSVDFGLLAEYLAARSLRVLDLGPGASPEEIAESRRFLEKVGLA